MIVVAPWWPMMHWLWGLVSHSTKPPATATSLVSKTAIQSEIPSESVALAPSCLVP